MGRVVAGMLAVVAGCLVPATAHAAVSNGSLTLSPDAGPASTTITATFTFSGGLPCRQTVSFSWDSSNPHPLGSAAASTSGTSCQAKVEQQPPADDAVPGRSYTVTADTTSSPQASGTASFAVTDAAPSGAPTPAQFSLPPGVATSATAQPSITSSASASSSDIPTDTPDATTLEPLPATASPSPDSSAGGGAAPLASGPASSGGFPTGGVLAFAVLLLAALTGLGLWARSVIRKRRGEA